MLAGRKPDPCRALVKSAARKAEDSSQAQADRHGRPRIPDRPDRLRGSVSEARLTQLGARKIFDRTRLNLAIWLPLSEQAGGAPAIWPNSPPIPMPGVEHLGEAHPKAA